jgi:hypothetical protein
MSAQYFWELQSPPRQVRLRRGARWFFLPGLIASALIIGVVVGFVMWFMGNELKTLRRLEANGRLATAWVEKSKVVDDQRPLRLWGSPRVDVSYAFQVDGRTFVVHKEYLPGELPSVCVQVLYWPNDPNVNLIRDKPIIREEVRHAEAWFWSGPTAGIALFLAAVILIGLPLAIIPGELNISRQFDLAERGLAAEAVVTRLVRDSLGRCRIHYEFPTRTGTWRGSSLLASRTCKVGSMHAGQRLTALFDPQSPRRNILVLALDDVEPVGTWDARAGAATSWV